MTRRSEAAVATGRGPLIIDVDSVSGPVVPVQSQGGPTTLDAWVDYCTTVPQRPQETTRSRYDAAPVKTREAFDEARKQYHRSLADIQTPQMTLAHAEISSRLGGTGGCPPTARTGLVVSGDPNLGKSTLMLRWGKVFEQKERDRLGVGWNARTSAGGLFVPVVYVILSDGEGPKGLCQKMMRFYGQPFVDSWDADHLTALLKVLATRCATRVLLIDQMQNLQMGNRSGRQTANHLKSIMDDLPVTVVGAAVDIDQTRFFGDPQIAGRFGVHYIQPFTRPASTDDTSFLSLLETVYDRLVLLDKRPGDMAALAGYVYDRTCGVTGDLMDLLRRGANAAVGTSERLDRELLDTVNLSAKRHPRPVTVDDQAVQDAAAAAAVRSARATARAIRQSA